MQIWLLSLFKTLNVRAIYFSINGSENSARSRTLCMHTFAVGGPHLRSVSETPKGVFVVGPIRVHLSHVHGVTFLVAPHSSEKKNQYHQNNSHDHCRPQNKTTWVHSSPHLMIYKKKHKKHEKAILQNDCNQNNIKREIL